MATPRIPFIEVRERFYPDGIRARLTGLPAGHYCVIRPNVMGSAPYERKTCTGGNGSIRYATYSSYEEAVADSIKWARRKHAEEARRSGPHISISADSSRFVGAMQQAQAAFL